MINKVLALFILILGAFQWEELWANVSTPKDLASITSGGVAIFTSKDCSYCEKAKDYLNVAGVEYEEYDIDLSTIAREHYNSLGGGGLPLMSMNGVILHGFIPAKIQNFLDNT